MVLDGVGLEPQVVAVAGAVHLLAARAADAVEAWVQQAVLLLAVVVEPAAQQVLMAELLVPLER